MKRFLLILLLPFAAIAAPPTAAELAAKSPPLPVKDTQGRSYDENGLNRAPLIILDQHGKPLTPDSKVLNRGKDVGCGLERIGDVFRVVRCK